jgi:NAD(P)-dependent dehydrogenase (short-subunit alcohol dehydrogenase family)
MPKRIEIPDEFPVVGDVSGKRVVLTGAGRGLGELIAHALSRAGAKVALVARTERDLAEVAAALRGPTMRFSGDVRDQDFNDAVADQTVAEWGGLDVWICNAGISPIVAGPLETSPGAWREVIDVNLTGTFLGARAAAGRMGAGGRIIVTGSVLGDRPHGRLAAYSASKGGVHALVRSLAQELGPREITANAVALGWFETGLGAFWHGDERREHDIAEHTALGRWGTAADLPGVYLFLASAASAYITGTTITVDGGYSLL